MYNYFHWNGVPHYSFAMLALLGVFMVWSIVWKAIALWFAARDGKPWWFAALWIINTAGLLEILYIFVVRKRIPQACPKCGCPNEEKASCC